MRKVLSCYVILTNLGGQRTKIYREEFSHRLIRIIQPTELLLPSTVLINVRFGV